MNTADLESHMQYAVAFLKETYPDAKVHSVNVSLRMGQHGEESQKKSWNSAEWHLQVDGAEVRRATPDAALSALAEEMVAHALVGELVKHVAGVLRELPHMGIGHQDIIDRAFGLLRQTKKASPTERAAEDIALQHDREMAADVR